MKNSRNILLFLFSIIITNLAFADEEQDRETLKNYLSTFESALNNNEINKIIPLLAEEVVITFVNAETVRGVPEVIKYHEKTLGSSSALLKDYSTKATISAPARFYQNIAIATGTALDTYTLANGDVIEMETIWSVTLSKDETQNKWKIAQLHFSANPFDNPVMQAINNKLLLVGVICAVVGLILGLLIGRLRKKHIA